MRIAYISFEFPPDTARGGIATYTVQAAEMMAGRGHEVEVFAGGDSDRTVCTASGIRVHTIKCLNHCRFAFPAGLVFARRHVERPFDVVEAPEYQAEAEAAIRLVPDIPLVIRMHSPSGLLANINTPQWERNIGFAQAVSQCRMFAGAWRRQAPLPSLHLANPSIVRGRETESRELAVAREADEVVAPSLALARHAVQDWLLPEERVTHLPNPFAPSPALLKVPAVSEAPTVGFYGRLEVRKGILSLGRAIPEIVRACPSVRFLFIGKSERLDRAGTDAAARLGQICSGLGVSAEFPGYQPLHRMPDWLAGCRVAVFPSIWENFPYVCLEAMAAGRAVVASSAGGMADMIQSGRNGLLHAPGDHRQLASRIVHLLRDVPLCREMGAAAKLSVLARYSVEALGEKYEHCYQRAIAVRQSLGSRIQPWTCP